MSNLVARLRGLYPIEPSNIIAVCDEAADEMERQAERIAELEARHGKFLKEFWKTNADNERLRAALQEIADDDLDRVSGGVKQLAKAALKGDDDE